MQPLVSIITPSFNQGIFLEETILSVLNQDYTNIEYIIIDGGSTDNSIDLIKKYESKISYWVSEKDSGQADAINKGFKRATGDYICWVNSDDLLYPGFVSARVGQFKNHPGVGMIYGDVDQGWTTDQKILRKGKQQTFDEMLNTCIVRVPQMSAVWSRNAFDTIGLLSYKLNVLLDWEYILRTAEHVPVLYLPGSVAFFRQHKDSKSVKHSKLWANEIESYYKGLFSREKFTEKFKRSTLVNMYFYCAGIFKEDGEVANEKAYLLQAKKAGALLYAVKNFTNALIFILVKTKKTLQHGRK